MECRVCSNDNIRCCCDVLMENIHSLYPVICKLIFKKTNFSHFSRFQIFYTISFGIFTSSALGCSICCCKAVSTLRIKPFWWVFSLAFSHIELPNSWSSSFVVVAVFPRPSTLSLFLNLGLLFSSVPFTMLVRCLSKKPSFKWNHWLVLNRSLAVFFFSIWFLTAWMVLIFFSFSAVKFAMVIFSNDFFHHPFSVISKFRC